MTASFRLLLKPLEQHARPVMQLSASVQKTRPFAQHAIKEDTCAMNTALLTAVRYHAGKPTMARQGGASMTPLKSMQLPLKACRSVTWRFTSASVRLSLATLQHQNGKDTLERIATVLANEEKIIALHQ